MQRLAILEHQGRSFRAEINRISRRPPTHALRVPQEIQVTPPEHEPAEIQTLVEQTARLLRAQVKSIDRGENTLALAKLGPEEKLRPDMYANVELNVPLGLRLAVPKDAVLETGERKIVFIHHGGSKLEWRNVAMGVRAAPWVETTEDSIGAATSSPRRTF